MSETNAIAEKLIAEYTQDYMGKLFYFCLKKTGNSRDAEDLTSDISVCVLSGLRKGTIPQSLPAWIWGIARNRYSVWADVRHKLRESISEADINELELAGEALIENEYVQSEELSLLRRELAFISSDYREIVVAYYIGDRSVKDISKSLGLPEGTVKSKLFRSRNILKEGMIMAREFGVMSYRPENVDFITNGIGGKNGEPWSFIKRAICKNIMLAAYRTPSAGQELSIELGIALPYMEDELNDLVGATLLKKNGGKYETNIFIVSALSQERIYANLRQNAPSLAQSVIAVMEYWVKCLAENGSQWHEGWQPYEDMKWALLMRTVDIINRKVLDEVNKSAGKLYTENIGKWGHTKRPNGGEWDLLGLEDYKGDRPAFVGLHGCIDSPDYMDPHDMPDFGQFKFNYKAINRKTPAHLSYQEVKALVLAAKGNVSSVPPEALEKLAAYGYLEKSGGGYKPTFCVMKKEKMKSRTQEQEAGYRRLLENAKNIAMEHYRFCRDVIYDEIPEFFKNDRYQIGHACANIYEMRGAVLEEALRTGYISYAENDDRKMLGAYLII